MPDCEPQASLCLPLVVVVVDAHNKWTRQKLDPGIVHILKDHSALPSVLVLNKVRLSSCMVVWMQH